MSEKDQQALAAFLKAHPETRFLDAFAPDINGVLRGKRVQAEEFEKLFVGGSNYCAASTLMNVRGEAPENVKYGAHDGDPDIRSIGVVDSLKPVPWASLPTAQCLLELEEFDGTPYPLDPRNVLRQSLAKLADLDLHPVMATELEFYLVDYDGDTFVPRMPKIAGSDWEQVGVQFASFDDLDDVEPFLVDLDAFCRIQDIPAGAALSEYSPGQFEVNLNHVDDPVLACDHALLLKRAVKAAAKKNGLSATFMAKPFAEHAGSGLHMHISLLDGDGKNVFSGQGEDDFSDTLRHAIGGLRDVMPESMAIFAPNANSYRRYAPGWYVPASPNWGPNHRDLALRIPISSQKNRRVEHRVSGADANPHLVAAAIFAGIHHGISGQLDPGPMTEEKADIDYKVTLPVRWPLALNAFEAGSILPHYLGQEYHRVFGVVKREESDRFHSEITDRDYEWYLRAV
ncbi:MAG: glutamine synthetase family protein [Gammaproteobacteria bacterium]|nr:glutamine synthetase family protein [Gammaproteobacteria bacterium]